MKLGRPALLLASAAIAVLTAFASHASPPAPATVPVGEKHPVDPNPPAAKGTMLELASPDGTIFKAYVSRPAAKPKGAVLVMHEWWGLNGWIEAQSDELAALGYLALAPDLYRGTVAKTPDEAGKLMGAMNQGYATSVEVSAIAYLKANAGGAKIATVGWCMGGGQSLQASLASPGDVAATVIYYGMPESDLEKLKTLKGPVLGLFAKKDGWITPEVVAAFDKRLTDAGIKHAFTIYDADHAFANPTGGKHNPPAAKDAWAKTVAFLAENLK